MTCLDIKINQKHTRLVVIKTTYLLCRTQTYLIDVCNKTDSILLQANGLPWGGAMHLRALYFTRATAPYGDGPLYHHIGIYAYRRESLARFVSLKPSPLEMREKLEQLRALEAGMRIDVVFGHLRPQNGVFPYNV